MLHDRMLFANFTLIRPLTIFLKKKSAQYLKPITHFQLSTSQEKSSLDVRIMIIIY